MQFALLTLLFRAARFSRLFGWRGVKADTRGPRTIKIAISITSYPKALFSCAICQHRLLGSLTDGGESFTRSPLGGRYLMLLRARWERGAPWPRLLPALRNGLGCCRKFVLGWTGSSAPEGVLGYLASQSSAVEMTLVGGQYHALFVPVGTKRYEGLV
ncbi:hypothetical protein V8C40DRAFT_238528 [Trichoderma camerunense]